LQKLIIAAGVLVCAQSAAFAGGIFGFTNGNPAPFLTISTTAGVFTSTGIAFDTGWYDQTGFHGPTNRNYAAANPAILPDVTNGDTNHDFFAFRLGAGVITGNILSATLTAFNPPGGYVGPAGGAMFDLWDVSTNIDTLVAGGSGLVGIFNDLGSGASYGSRLVSAADSNSSVVIGISGQGLTDLQTAYSTTSLFAIGGSFDAISSVPEPGTYALMGIGFAALGWLKRRK
jgi:large repetitive protein